MTSSRSIISALVALATLVMWMTVADAGSRKRVVVLDFEGPKAEKFHDDLVRLIKKSHTVVPTDKWNSTAEELDAGKPTEKNIKKVAKKLKVDGVVVGKIEKRRDEYILRLKLHAGTTGEMAGNSIETKAEGPRIDGKAQRDIKDELIGALDELDANHGGGGGDDEEDKPAKTSKKKASSDDEEEETPKPKKTAKKAASEDEEEETPKRGFSKKADGMGNKKKGGDDEEDETPKTKKTAKKTEDEEETKPKKTAKKTEDEEETKPKKTAKKSDDEEETKSKKTAKKSDDEEETRPKKASKKSDDEESGDDEGGKKKKVASKGDDEEGEGSAEAEGDTEVDQAAALSPSGRAVDATLGLSLTGRNLSFSYAPNIAKPPPGYKQALPVAGLLFDATIFPLAIGHKRHDMLAGLGAELLYDKVLAIKSQKLYVDMAGNNAVATQATSESRFALAAVFRYPLAQTANAMVVGGKLAYGTHDFSIAQTLPNNMPVDIPSVTYKYVEPSAFLNYPASPKMVVNAALGIMLVSGIGQIGQADQYGQAGVLGVEFNGGLDYMLSKNLFARANIHVETYGFSFKNNPAGQTNMRDSDPTTQDVGGARDTYFGGAVTVGYLY